MIEVRRLEIGYEQKTVAKEISFTLDTGEVLCLLGPNGAGKTTLFKTILGFLPKQEGEILLDGTQVDYRDRKRLARHIAYVPQAHEPPFPFGVLDVVLMGSLSKCDLFMGPSKKEKIQAEQILEELGIRHLKNAVYTEISGGERQMVLIARALMQEPRYLMMDEPTSNLDFGNQIRVLEQIGRLAVGKMGIIMTSHFPDHAFLCCSRAAVLSKGKPFAIGDVEDIVTEQKLHEAYGIRVRVAKVRAGEGTSGTVTTCIPLLRVEKEEQGAATKEMRPASIHNPVCGKKEGDKKQKTFSLWEMYECALRLYEANQLPLPKISGIGFEKKWTSVRTEDGFVGHAFNFTADHAVYGEIDPGPLAEYQDTIGESAGNLAHRLYGRDDILHRSLVSGNDQCAV